VIAQLEQRDGNPLSFSEQGQGLAGLISQSNTPVKLSGYSSPQPSCTNAFLNKKGSGNLFTQTASSPFELEDAAP